MDPAPIHVAALYQFTRFPDREAVRGPLLALALAQGIKGTLLVAHEGLNGTIAGPKEGLDAVIAHIRALPGCADIAVKWSTAAAMPFGKMLVKLKREIVTMGVPDVDPTALVGTYVPPAEWNALISQPDVVLIDTRNDYEVVLGRFEGAVDPQTPTFRDFPAWFRANRDALGPNPRVAMYCTGGIRCEKSTAFLKAEGVEEVFHLAGGILKYLEDIPEEESLWRGGCFVFDERVSLGHGLRTLPVPEGFKAQSPPSAEF
ncbi:oxygen-dependent tRNA uridine(34) hydroxylase TrhO [Alteraurantiacibacter buctensis]|uniref:tRNA uridine(34) hydroxylase n=1 Tax=Alteraurantiacibacter buctensis TaxID=1503981 RepID=A0A844YUL0_9SPHN|nr:rhodanese-related sulfurtransferase [Alteraurantiacibacter buctensis]